MNGDKKKLTGGGGWQEPGHPEPRSADARCLAETAIQMGGIEGHMLVLPLLGVLHGGSQTFTLNPLPSTFIWGLGSVLPNQPAAASSLAGTYLIATPREPTGQRSMPPN